MSKRTASSKLLGQESDHWVKALVGVISVLCLGAAYFITQQTISYPLIFVAFGGFIYLLYPPVDGTHAPTLPFSLQSVQVKIGIGVLNLLIFAAVLSPWFHATPRLPGSLFALTILVLIAVLLLAISSDPDSTTNILIFLIPIILIAIYFRQEIWFSYGLYGQDSKLHLALIDHITAFGAVIPPGVTYYRFYPIAHLSAAVSTLVMDVDSKLGYFVSVGLPAVLSVLILIPVFRRITEKSSHIVAGVAVVLFSAGTLHLGTELYAQTLANAFIPFLLYLLFYGYSSRQGILVSIMMLAAIFTHNLFPLILVGSVVTLKIANLNFGSILSTSSEVLDTEVASRSWATSMGAVAMLGVYYYIFAEYVSYQINRFILIFSFGEGSLEGKVAETNSGTAPTVSLADVDLPALLMWAAPNLVLVLTFVFVTYTIVEFGLNRRISNSKKTLFVFASIFFGTYSIAFIIGGQGPVTRLLPAITIIAAPVVVMGIQQLRQTGYVAPIALVLLFVTAGMLSPTVAMPNRSPGDFKPMATTAEIQCGQFAVAHSDAVVGDSYFAGELNTREQLGLSEGVMDTGLAVDEPRNTTLYAQSFPGEATTVYRETVADYFRIARPPGEDMVFANGDCSIYY